MRANLALPSLYPYEYTDIPAHGPTLMTSLPDDLARFFEALPQSVRDDLCFMLVTLSDENLLADDLHHDRESAARRLFDARTPIGRLGNLINVVSIFDVYFALDMRSRFGPSGLRYPGGRPARHATAMLKAYAARLEAAEAAAHEWRELRRTTFNPAAIAAALVPPDPPVRRRTRSAAQTTAHVDSHHDAIS